jgi:hypothetical protein
VDRRRSAGPGRASHPLVRQAHPLSSPEYRGSRGGVRSAGSDGRRPVRPAWPG